MSPIYFVRDLLTRRKAATQKLQHYLAGIERMPLSEFIVRRAHGELTDEQAYAFSLRRKREAQTSIAWFLFAEALGLVEGHNLIALMCAATVMFYLAVLIDSELSLWRLRGGVGGLAQLTRTPGWWRELFDGERLGLRLNAIELKA